ncbi:MAG: PQQ-binding-like beta-propeller repeat protein [Planctomycetes bacterium]|nr:PQQ-binding-like beta-propeller repeat protein [Planctomycetota bacterium]
MGSEDLRSDLQVRMAVLGIGGAAGVEGGLLILQIGGEDEACLIALDKMTGEQRWTALPDVASYAAPIVIDQCGKRVLVCKTGDRIVGLGAATGKLHWAVPVPWKSWPIGIATPVLDRDMLLTTEAHKGTLLLRLSTDSLTVDELWHRGRQNSEDKTALHCLISTPYVDGDFIYGADSRGVLRCLRLDTGKQVWEDRTAVPEDRFATIHLIRNGDRTWLFNEQGEMIIARLTPQGFNEISRAKLLDTTTEQLPRRRGGVTWSHPAFAYRHVFARNDKELVCADVSAK